MKSMFKKCVLAVALVATLVAVCASYGIIGGSNTAYADVEEITTNALKSKILFYTLHQCYTEGNVLKSSIDYDSTSLRNVFFGMGSIFKDSTKPIPTGFFNSKEELYCNRNEAQLSGTEISIVERIKPDLSIDASNHRQRTAYYEGMGYTSSNTTGATTTGEGVKCLYLNYHYEGQLAHTNDVCMEIDASGNITAVHKGDVETTEASGSDVTFRASLTAVAGDTEARGEPDYNGERYTAFDRDFALALIVVARKNDRTYSAIVHVDLAGAAIAGNTNYDENYELIVANIVGYESTDANYEWDPADKYLLEELMRKYSGASQNGFIKDSFDIDVGDIVVVDRNATPEETIEMNHYEISNGEAGYKSAYRYLKDSNASDADALAAATFDEAEKYYVYFSYLGNYGATVSYNFCDDNKSNDVAYIPVVKTNDSGSKVWTYCIINEYTAKKNVQKKNSFESNGIYAKAANHTLQEVVEKLRGFNTSSIPAERLPANGLAGEGEDPNQPVSGNPESGEEPEEAEVDSDADCYSNAGSLGWILCPIINGLQNFILEQYASIIAPALQIDAGLFTTSSTGTYTAWGTFRDIANYIFVVFLIVVIFSQITGFGIDNYGIKKALPKLIVAAILINLSYLICQIAIDIANIVGNSIGGLFQEITKGLDQIGSSVAVNFDNDSTKITVPHNAWDSFWSSGWNPVIIVIIGVICFATVLSQGWAILIPVILALISIVIAVFGLIVILGIRQAAAVLLVVASPLAFTCYMLPNTKSIYKKWEKAFMGLLIAFPVCSALVYGGDMVSHILLNAANGHMWVLISAGVIGVAPVFFIPKVISGCMGAISGGVMKLANKGRGKARGAAKKRLDNSWMTKRKNYKQQMRQQKANARTLRYNAKKGQAVIDKYKGHEAELTAGQRQKYNMAMSAVNAQTQDAENAYGSSFKNLTEEEKSTRLLAAAGYKVDKKGALVRDEHGNLVMDPEHKHKPMDANMVAAGLASIKDSSQLESTLRALNGSDSFRQTMERDGTMRGRVADIMSGSQGDVINQSIGKMLRDDKSTTLDDIFDTSNGKLAAQVQRAGSGVMGSQNAEVFKHEGAADLFSDEQLAASATSELSGAAEENFFDMMSGVSDERKGNVVTKMSDAGIGRLRVNRDSHGVDHGTLGAVGGAAMIHAKKPEAITTIRSAAGANIRLHQQGEAARELGTDSGDS